jgi:hypothetical protein
MVTTRTAFAFATLSGFVLLAAAAQTAGPGPEAASTPAISIKTGNNAMPRIKQGMVLGVDKNVYVEPTIWTIEWARDFYKYPVTRSN